MRYPTTNLLLRALSDRSWNDLEPHFSHVEFVEGVTLQKRGDDVDWLWFPENGVLSVLLSSQNMDIEIGFVGSEGVCGASEALLRVPSNFEIQVQVSGWSWRLEAEAFRSLWERDDEFRKRVLAHTHFLLAQAAQSALCNRLHTVEERLSRWLLMLSEHVGSDSFELSPSFVAAMLGTRATSVPIALGILQQSGLIRCGDGCITILQPREVEDLACDCAHVLRDQLQHLRADLTAENTEELAISSTR